MISGAVHNNRFRPLKEVTVTFIPFIKSFGSDHVRPSRRVSQSWQQRTLEKPPGFNKYSFFFIAMEFSPSYGNSPSWHQMSLPGWLLLQARTSDYFHTGNDLLWKKHMGYYPWYFKKQNQPRKRKAS
jgi:hypothetical protein